MIKMGKGVLVPSYLCNQRCTCCYAMADILQAKQVMSFEEAKTTIDFFDAIGIRTFTILGGEPLIYSHILGIVEYAIKKGLTSWIVTNGIQLCDVGLGDSLVAAGLLGGCISMFSTTASVHESITNVPGSFQKMTQALKNTLDRGWPFYPMLTIGEANLDSVFQDVSWLAAMGFHRIYVNYGIPNVIDKYETNFAASPEELALVTGKLFKMQDELGVVFVFNCEKNKIPICLFDPEIFKQMVKNKQIGFGCELVQGNTVVVEPGGNILGCSHWVKNVLMNLYKDYETLTTWTTNEFWDIWMNGYPKQVREEQNCYPYETCEACNIRIKGKCWGGCKTWHHNGTFEHSHIGGYHEKLL